MTAKPLIAATLALFCAALAPAASALDAKVTPDQIDFFEKKIRPVLSEKCYKCHSEKAEKLRGELLLDTREGTRRGGENGPAVVPGDLDKSLLIDAVRYHNKDTAMPPEKAGGKLPDAVIADFEAWVKMGAPDPRDGAAKVVKKYDIEEAKKWWSFQPIVKPQVPQPKDAAWARSDIDRILLAGLDAKGLKPVGDADKATLLRRVYFDLIGLPPATADIDAFLKDTSPNAFEKVVDKLLASPQFGERWGRHWLDVARYAESNGKDVNIAFPHAWRYRDYVIGAFNADKPYDQFLREQIAGDLLQAKDDKQRAEQLTATAFLAIGAKGLNEQNARQFALDLADEQIDTMSQAILGITASCARCHDHKFDPIPQRDYYSLAGIFLSTETKYGTAKGVQNRHPTELISLPVNVGATTLGKTLPAEERTRLEKQLSDLREEQRNFIAARRGILNAGNEAATPTPAPQRRGVQSDQLRALVVLTQIGKIELTLKSYDDAGNVKALAMGVGDRPAQGGDRFSGRMFRGASGGRFAPAAYATITDSPLYARGEVDKPGEKVPRGFFTALGPASGTAIPAGASGRRELADWLASPQNPLTARVMVNRVWHWLYGRGIVESVDNFGNAGGTPSNAALLDHLATRFVENGWSVKKLIREIVLSRSYQMSSAYDEKSFAADPDNTLVWRMSKRRLDAECVRDAMLSVSGQITLTPPVGSLVAQNGDGLIGEPRFRGMVESSIVDASGTNRSVYLPVPRDILPDALAVFDFAEPSLVTGARETTNVPSQALYMLNSPFVGTQAQKLADRLLASLPGGPNGGVAASFDERLGSAYWLVFGRAPDQVERTAALAFLNKFPSNWSKGDNSTAGLKDAEDVKAAWTSLCRALFASAEFRYLN